LSRAEECPHHALGKKRKKEKKKKTINVSKTYEKNKGNNPSIKITYLIISCK